MLWHWKLSPSIAKSHSCSQFLGLSSQATTCWTTQQVHVCGWFNNALNLWNALWSFLTLRTMGIIKITHLLTNTHYLTSNCGQSKFLIRPTFPKSSTESLPLPLQNFACSMRSTSHLRRLQSQVYHLSSSDHPALSVTWSSHYWHSQHQSLWTFSSKCLCSLISGLVWTLYAKGISFSPQTCLKHWPDQDLLQTCCYQALHFSCHNWDHACLEVKWWMISLI